jgi:hypothetical protein
VGVDGSAMWAAVNSGLPYRLDFASLSMTRIHWALKFIDQRLIAGERDSSMRNSLFIKQTNYSEKSNKRQAVG